MGTIDRATRDDHTAAQKGHINAEKAAMGAIDVEAKVTVYVILACTIAASGGVLFGKPIYCVAAAGCDVPGTQDMIHLGDVRT